MQTSRIRSDVQIELLKTLREIAGDTVIIAPAIISSPLDDTKYNTKTQIFNTEADLVASEIEALVDKGSLLLHAVKRFRQVNKEAKLYVVPLEDDGDAVKATADITFSGTTVAESTTASFISPTNYEYSINAIAGETFDQIAAKVRTAINANPYEIFTAGTYTTPTLTLTAKNGGTHMNNQCFDWSNFIIPGIEIETENFSGGVFNPDITTILDELKNMPVHFVVPNFGWDAVDTHLQEKEIREFANGQLFGYFATDLIAPIANVASMTFEKAERNGYFMTSVLRDINNTDGTYFDTISSLHSFLVAVDSYASTNLQIHQNATLQRPSSPKYLPNVGGPNQYMRSFNGTILPNVPLSPFTKSTMLTGSETKALESKGLSYVFPDSIYQNVITSQLFTGDLTFQNSAGRTLNQLLLRTFFRKLVNKTIQEQFSDARISVKNAESTLLISENTFKAELLKTLSIASQTYPSLIPNDNLKALHDLVNTTFKLYILDDGIIQFEGTLAVDQHVEEFKGKVQVATYQQIS